MIMQATTLKQVKPSLHIKQDKENIKASLSSSRVDTPLKGKGSSSSPYSPFPRNLSKQETHLVSMLLPRKLLGSIAIAQSNKPISAQLLISINESTDIELYKMIKEDFNNKLVSQRERAVK